MIYSQADREYANAFLVKYSANNTPPYSIDPNQTFLAGDYRLFNDLKGRKNKLSKADLAKLKVALCRKHKLKKIPTDIEILLNVDENFLDKKLIGQFQEQSLQEQNLE